jgi:hypothetical protein
MMRRPRGAQRIAEHGARLIVQGGEEFGETRIDGIWVVDPFRVEVGDESRVCAAEGGGEKIDACHEYVPVPDCSLLTHRPYI